jgi:hypothetical protein
MGRAWRAWGEFTESRDVERSRGNARDVATGAQAGAAGPKNRLARGQQALSDNATAESGWLARRVLADSAGANQRRLVKSWRYENVGS